MENQDKTYQELLEYCEAQQKVIIQLNKKIQKLENEKLHLEDLLKNAPSVKVFGEKELSLTNDMATEEAICALQVKRLEEVSLGRELTLEETRKLETFSKILETFRRKDKNTINKTKDIKPEELLRIVNDDGK